MCIIKCYDVVVVVVVSTDDDRSGLRVSSSPESGRRGVRPRFAYTPPPPPPSSSSSYTLHYTRSIQRFNKKKNKIKNLHPPPHRHPHGGLCRSRGGLGLRARVLYYIRRRTHTHTYTRTRTHGRACETLGRPRRRRWPAGHWLNRINI